MHRLALPVDQNHPHVVLLLELRVRAKGLSQLKGKQKLRNLSEGHSGRHRVRRDRSLEEHEARDTGSSGHHLITLYAEASASEKELQRGKKGKTVPSQAKLECCCLPLVSLSPRRASGTPAKKRRSRAWITKLEVGANLLAPNKPELRGGGTGSECSGL